MKLLFLFLFLFIGIVNVNYGYDEDDDYGYSYNFGKFYKKWLREGFYYSVFSSNSEPCKKQKGGVKNNYGIFALNFGEIVSYSNKKFGINYEFSVPGLGDWFTLLFIYYAKEENKRTEFAYISSYLQNTISIVMEKKARYNVSVGADAGFYIGSVPNRFYDNISYIGLEQPVYHFIGVGPYVKFDYLLNESMLLRAQGSYGFPVSIFNKDTKPTGIIRTTLNFETNFSMYLGVNYWLIPDVRPQRPNPTTGIYVRRLDFNLGWILD